MIWFAHVLWQCEKHLIRSMKHLEFRFKLRWDRRGVTAVAGWKEKNYTKNLRNKHHDDKRIMPVKFYTFLCRKNAKAGNERVLLTSVDSAAEVWSRSFLCGSVVHKLLKTHQWVTLLHRLPRHLVIMTVGDSLYWVSFINTLCMYKQGHQMNEVN